MTDIRPRTDKRRTRMAISVLAVGAASAMAITACSPTASEPEPTEVTASADEQGGDVQGTLLFGQTSTSGSLEPVKGSGERSFVLTLRGVDETVGAFTDRPERRALTLPVQQFVTDWPEAFGDDPPNVLISTHIDADQAGVVAATIDQPEYSKKDATITYRAEVIQPDGNESGNYSLSSATENLPTEFGATELFIDGASSKLNLGR